MHGLNRKASSGPSPSQEAVIGLSILDHCPDPIFLLQGRLQKTATTEDFGGNELLGYISAGFQTLVKHEDSTECICGIKSRPLVESGWGWCIHPCASWFLGSFWYHWLWYTSRLAVVCFDSVLTRGERLPLHLLMPQGLTLSLPLYSVFIKDWILILILILGFP